MADRHPQPTALARSGVRRTGGWVLLLGGWLLAASGGGGVIAGQQPPERLVGASSLLRAAEDGDVDFLGISVPLSARPAGELPEKPTFKQLATALGMEVVQGEGVAVLLRRSSEVGRIPPALEGLADNSLGAIRTKAGVEAAQCELAQAFMASLTPAQRALVDRPWHPAAIALAYEYLARWGAADAINMGGFLDGSRMTDFQRRLCAVIAFADPPVIDMEYLASASEIAFGDFAVFGGEGPIWRPEVMVTNYQLTPTSVSLRTIRGSLVTTVVRLSVPADTLQGERLAQLVAWARANTPPPRTEWRWVPNFAPKHRTDGPTRALTDLMDADEADRAVFIPQDIQGLTIAEVLEYFRPYGYQFVVPSDILSQRTWVVTSDPERADGALTFLTALNSVIYDWPSRMWRREGNTFSLAYDFGEDVNHLQDPYPWLTDDQAQRPVTMAAPMMTLPELLAAVREQTGVPVLASNVVEGANFRLTIRLADVPVGRVLGLLSRHLGGIWERTPAGELLLVPEEFAVQDRSGWYCRHRPVRPEEWERYRATVASLSLALLQEALGLEQFSRSQLESSGLPPIPQHLLKATAHAAMGVTEFGTAPLAVVGLPVLPGSSEYAVLALGQRTCSLPALMPPTIPPNPRSHDYVMAGAFVHRTGSGFPPGFAGVRPAEPPPGPD